MKPATVIIIGLIFVTSSVSVTDETLVLNNERSAKLLEAETTKGIKKCPTNLPIGKKCRIIKRKRTTTIRWSQKTNDMWDVIVMSPDRDVWALTPRPKNKPTSSVPSSLISSKDTITNTKVLTKLSTLQPTTASANLLFLLKRSTNKTITNHQSL